MFTCPTGSVSGLASSTVSPALRSMVSRAMPADRQGMFFSPRIIQLEGSQLVGTDQFG